MAWSTRELAGLAGTTVKAVRYYHQLGLLDEPERLSNNYKQYEVRHLVRLLQITRLTELGVPLAQIESLGSSVDDPQAALRTIDAELAATIERLQRIRRELAAILQHGTSASLPEGFAEAGRDLSAADQSLLLIWSRVFDAEAMGDLRQMLIDTPRTAADIALDELPADADRATRRRLSEEIAPGLAAMVEKYPWLNDPGSRARGSASSTQSTVVDSVGELYNGAQREVLYRASLISSGSLDALAALEAALPPEDDAEEARASSPDPVTSADSTSTATPRGDDR
ncbi:helix-turn-helix domain-containing protein [Frigoribacterium faeni]|uniref:DNA-binding transcriptional MerR regulator n=1 Tax=Frigoribacterium faeni TaxID=145483 RepID=A0A7W3PIR0_9MICO|nr:MerR family transcriptional regulator [Frigoribacterium faeni]MBA8813146.1 DNA-binding transcriptional MerR regulator [Frigoribacterium faeni]BFF14337.1 MerR family transcriptional regulator [Microbacterium flavescens]GEK83450.1 transcriptional regulator, MerR family protein [Frigoribacterium faeni]